VATVSPAALALVAPEVSFFDLMYLFKDYEHWRRALDGSLGRHMADVIRRATGKAGTPGFEVLGYWSGSPLNIVGRSRGYQTFDDLLGMKVRNQGVGVQIEQWKALGARPVMVPYDGVYAAFKDAALDATPGVVPSVYSMKFHEVAPHISETTHSFIVRICVMSGHTWNRLSPEQQGYVTEAAREATVVARALEAQQEKELAELLRTKHGVKFYPFRDKAVLRQKTESVRQRFARDHGLTEILAGLETEWARR
jgi:C4-dicarboxylate-binding protein DctP